VAAHTEGPFLKWQNCSGKAAKASGERGDPRTAPPGYSPSGKEGAANEWQL